ncbi:Retrovirus-related Pol polyprotein from transposon TNT 1-94 [Vitis vinifera]|uniref:Retrovirus-related Pol polyprotein from transposon TNT 1-94 n=1 Tax=Vitis vinifera TaxID=29760 RepID=A0A438D2C5_VITVI|nr:Retrovirus-related Pol polyprotein from transposon TNT 1-94 [Vitis vinifera]
MGQGYEDHLVTQEADIPEVERVQWRKIDAQLSKGLYTNDIQRLYKVASAIVHISQQDLDLSTYIGQIASLKEEFLTMMPLTPDVGAQQTQLDKFFLVLTLIGLRPDLEPFLTQPLEEDAVVTEVEVNVLIALIAINLATLAIVAIGYMDGLLALPMWPSPLILSCLSLRAPPHLRHLRLMLPLLPSLDRSTRKTIGIGRESQGLYHLTSDSSPAVCISTDALLLIHSRLGHPSLSKFQKMVPRFFQFVVAFVDNVREYFSAPFTSFMSHHGILHQSSCAHTPQQNGVAERKNRHLVETARTILLHSNVPFRFLGDAVLTACYLINRMPSSVLHDQIPHFLLFPDQPLYFLPPRVFGCTCFVHILTPGQDKLSAKAMKCLFLGYSKLQKGYRCYSLETHRYFISADVTFFEDSPFFSTTSEFLPVSDVLLLPIVSPSDVVPPRPLQVYHRRPRVATPLPLLRHLLTHFLSLRLLLPRLCLLLMIYRLLFGKSTHKALSHPGWRQAMVDEMAALHSNGTWDLVVLPSGKSTIGCRWVYAVKVGPDGQVDRLKACLVAKGYTQVYGSDYGDTFSPVAKIASVRLLLSMAAMCSWPLYQLDIKNVFLHGDLAEEVYMEQPPGFVAQGESGLVCRLCRSLFGLKQSPRAWFDRFSSVVQEFGMLCSTADYSVFYHHNSLRQCIYLVVYVDDVVITGSDQDAQSNSGVVLSQRKYALDILEETGMLDCKPIDTPMDPNVKLVPGQGEPLGDPGRYRRLSPCDSHWDVVIRILRYIKSTPGQGVLYENRGHTQVVGYTDADWAGSPTDRCSTSGYCIFIEGNIISWKSKKQDVVARFSVEAEYQAMALTTCKLIWLRHLLRELRFGKDEQMKLICDNQAALHITSNPVFHERTKTY